MENFARNISQSQEKSHYKKCKEYFYFSITERKHKSKHISERIFFEKRGKLCCHINQEQMTFGLLVQKNVGTLFEGYI